MIGYTGTGLALRLYPGEGDGTFGTPGEVSLDTSEAPTALASGDLDGDGRIDFAVAYESGLVRVVMGANTAELSLGASMTITEGSYPRSVVIADLDGDDDCWPPPTPAWCSGHHYLGIRPQRVREEVAVAGSGRPTRRSIRGEPASSCIVRVSTKSG